MASQIPCSYSKRLYFNFSTGAWAPQSEAHVLYFPQYSWHPKVLWTWWALNICQITTVKKGDSPVTMPGHSGEVLLDLQVFKRKRCEIPKLMPAVLPWDLPHEIASQGMMKRNSWEKCFTLFSSRRYHLGLFTLAVQWESKERILRMWVKGCNPHCTRLGVASVRWKILETPHLEKAPI